MTDLFVSSSALAFRREGGMKITQEKMEAAVLGGAILGGGGGGWIEEGREIARLALDKGFSEIVGIEDLPEEAVLLTVSAVGAPSAGSSTLPPDDYVRAVEFFIEKTGMKIDGLISSEVGALGVVNGWIQSACLHIPVVDAPCNGRAHPLGLMGSMGLHQQRDYVSLQTAVGGRREKQNRVEAFFEGSLAEVSRSVREAAVRAGGMVAVARNPVPAHYVKKNGAPGAIERALKVGEVLLKNKTLGSKETITAVVNHLGGNLVAEAKVQSVSLKTEGGLDVGEIRLKEGSTVYELTFWNEYMTLETEGTRLATFPDLIITFDSQTSLPLISAQIKEGGEVFLMTVPALQLLLGAGVKDEGLLKTIEQAIGKAIREQIGRV